MKRKYARKFVIKLLLIGTIIVFYIFYSGEKPVSPSPEHFYKISSLVEYDNNLCGSTLYDRKMNGFNSGIKLIFKDKATGDLLKGYATISAEVSGSGASSVSSKYSCREQINSEDVLISAYAKGYTPLVFNFKYPKNQLATLEIPMVKSCSGGPSCFDNIKLLSEINDNRTLIDELILENQNRFFDIIKDQFGLERSDYDLQCMECDMGRGGYIKAKGTHKNGSPLELYYRWGWCSPGGGDCGWDMCFNSASDDLFDSVKNNFCNRISSRQLHDEYTCTSESRDNTEEVRNKCSAGEFESTDGNRKTLSIVQNSDQCTKSVNIGGLNCLEN